MKIAQLQKLKDTKLLILYIIYFHIKYIYIHICYIIYDISLYIFYVHV